MDPDDVNAQQWQKSSATNVVPEPSSLPLECDDYWFIPTYTDTDVLEEQLEPFSHNTATHMTYNRQQERIDLWGPTPCIRRAKQALDHFASFYHDKAELKKKATKTKGWAKPDRELTPAEQKKKKRKDEKIMESRRYLGIPPEQYPFEHRLRWPNSLPVFRLLGGNLHALDDLRAECKSFVWIEQSSMTICIAGDDEHSTFTAMNRVKNYILKRTRAPIDTVCHILEKPSTLVEIQMAKTPPVPYIESPPQINSSQPSGMVNPSVFIRVKEVKEKTFTSLLTLDLSMAATEETDTSRVQDPISTSDRAQEAQKDTAGARDNVSSLRHMDNMTDRNIDRIREALEETLNQVQLQDGDIKMRIRIGQVAFIEYLKGSDFSVERLDQEMIPDKRLKSDFSPFITESSEMFVRLARKLTPPDNKDLITQPEVIWSLGILKRLEATHSHINVQLDVTFRDDEKVSLWNALVQKTTPLDIRVVSSESLFSWAWTITTGKRLEADKFSPEGKFVYELRLEKREGQDDRLVFANTPAVQLKYIRREKKRLFIHDPWTIELIEEAFWALTTAYKPYQSVALPEKPDHVLYSVSMYRDSWTTRFCENPHLSLGQVPTWDPADFFTGEESISKTMEAVNYLRDMVEDIF